MNPLIQRLSLLALSAAAVLGHGCTRQTDHSFQFLPVTEQFDGAVEVNTQVDILWVVDNSASMDVSQDRLRRGFRSFATKYLKPTWDIRVAVITTDTYLANTAFSDFLRSTIPNTNGWVSPYIGSRLDTFVNPPWNPNLVNLKTGAFSQGIRQVDQVPAWGKNFAKLLPGIHDGPIAALCSEAHPYFFYGYSQCRIRDDQNRTSGTFNCLNPQGGESAITQCVNTVQNDTVHSGRAILFTQPPAGVPADSAWTTQVADDFIINASAGSAGMGSERGFASVLQLLKDNEGTSTALFRKGSVRVIAFLSDEDDQSLEIPSTLPSGFGPFTYYSSSCASKTVDGYTYTLSTCPDPTRLMTVSSVKTQLDSFFRKLDGAGSTDDPGYFVVPIVPMTGASIRKLQAEREVDDAAVGTKNVAVDRGDRYLRLAQLVGSGSFAADIANDDYSGVLDSIGRAIVQQKSVFQLNREPGALEDVRVTVLRADGSLSDLPTSSYTIVGTTLTITDLDWVLSLNGGDRIQISYIPKTLY